MYLVWGASFGLLLVQDWVAREVRRRNWRKVSRWPLSSLSCLPCSTSDITNLAHDTADLYRVMVIWVRGHGSRVKGQWSTVNSQQSTVNSHRSKVSDQRSWYSACGPIQGRGHMGHGSSVNSQRHWSMVNGQHLTVNSQRSTINDQNNQRSTVNTHNIADLYRVMVDGRWSMVDSQWSTVYGQWSTVNGQRSTVNSQQSIVNSQPSTVNGQRSMIQVKVKPLPWYNRYSVKCTAAGPECLVEPWAVEGPQIRQQVEGGTGAGEQDQEQGQDWSQDRLRDLIRPLNLNQRQLKTAYRESSDK